jgi:hypothetical protein
MKRTQVVGLALAGIIASSAAALAAIEWTPENGGFVGKGDVQSAFGWNSQGMDANSEAITFVYETTGGFSFECEWWTGPDHNRQHHTNEKTIELDVDAVVTGTRRLNGAVAVFTGWNLDALGEIDDVVGGPVDSDCGAEGNGMKSIVPGSIEPLSGSGTGALYAVFNGERRLLQVF